MAAINRRPTTRRPGEAGYALLMAVFMIATIIVFTTAALPNLLTQGRREREEETIWRGEQYERAIGLHFRKLGRFPVKVEDLTRQTNGVRFLRQAYPDPMNKEDGSWRFIYVGPMGQLIGSLKPSQNLQLPHVGGLATPANALNGPGTPAQPGAIGQQAPGGTQPGGTNPPAAT